MLWYATCKVLHGTSNGVTTSVLGGGVGVIQRTSACMPVHGISQKWTKDDPKWDHLISAPSKGVKHWIIPVWTDRSTRNQSLPRTKASATEPLLLKVAY